jgi:hypothetical protein
MNLAITVQKLVCISENDGMGYGEYAGEMTVRVGSRATQRIWYQHGGGSTYLVLSDGMSSTTGIILQKFYGVYPSDVITFTGSMREVDSSYNDPMPCTSTSHYARDVHLKYWYIHCGKRGYDYFKVTFHAYHF